MYCQQKSHSCDVTDHAEIFFLLAQQILAVSEFNHCLSVALLNSVKGTFRNAGNFK